MKQPQNYEQWGRAATIPGLQMAIDYLQTMLDEIRAELYGTMAEPKRKVPFEPRTKRGRPPKIVDATAETTAVAPYKTDYWQKMTPEERSAEGRRRQAVARRRRLAKKAAAKAVDVTPPMTHHQTGALSWRNLTPEQRSEEMKRRQAVTREKRAAEVRQQMEKRYGSVKGPQNPNHPEHEAYVENMRQKALERWSDPNFREAQVQKMHDARDARDQLLNSEELQ